MFSRFALLALSPALLANGAAAVFAGDFEKMPAQTGHVHAGLGEWTLPVGAAIGAKVSTAGSPCELEKTESTCNGEADCTWCKSAAVPSSCYALNDAAHLPPSIFQCDKKGPSASA